MKAKKLLLFSMSAAMLAFMAFGASSCGASHEHSFSDWEVMTKPTCTAFGLRKRACDCGYIEYGTMDALTHTPVIDAAVEATCTTPGLTEGSHCGDCGVVITAQNTVMPLGHKCDQEFILAKALCNRDGKRKISCSNEGCTYYYYENYSLAALSQKEIFDSAVQYTGEIYTFDHLGGSRTNRTAFVISEDGKIVASNFILDNSFSAIFVLDDVIYDVTEVLAYSEKSNIAVLKIDATGLPYANICKKDPIDGETVYAVGAPDGYEDSMASGVISNAKRQIGGVNYIQYDINISAGYMGGPLLNKFGEVIGINVGVMGESQLKVSVWAAELDKLDYSNPMSMEEYGKTTYSPMEQISEWVETHYIGTQNDDIAYILEGSNFYYSLGYNTQNKYNFAEGYWIKDSIYTINVHVMFDSTNGTYQYHASLTDGIVKNEVHGFLDAATYTRETALTYDTFYGRYWSEAELMELYSSCVSETLEWFSYCLEAYFHEISLETFGFSSLSYEYDEGALDKLNTFVAQNGTLDSEKGAYTFVVDKQTNDAMEVLEINYTPETESSPASMVATMYYVMGNSEVFSVSLNLNPMEEGYRFDVSYSTYDGTELVTQNYGWGYLDANSLTNVSVLTCYEFFGLNDFEDSLLRDYASLLSIELGYMNELLATIDPALGIEDLGFLFYFG